MKIFAVLLVLPALVLARIDVEIIASDNENQRQVLVSGSNVDIISDLEIETFELSQENLKSAVNSYFGEMPDDVFLRSPTPWGDLYVTNNWKPVSRVLKPLRAKVLSITNQTAAVIRKTFNNTSTKPATFTAEMRQDVENTVASMWERTGELSAQNDMVYNFDIKAMAMSGKATFSYVSKWGENVLKSQKVTVGSSTGLEINLAPNQSVIAELAATRGSMKVEIFYEATLSGSVAVNYANLHKDHHFWSADINKVLTAGKMKKSVLSSEVIDLGFYSDANINIRDVYTLDILQVLPIA